jgi:hypothetical protein
MPIVLDGSNGVTFPTWTTATRPASPATGMQGYNTTIGQMEFYSGTAWIGTSTLPTYSVEYLIVAGGGAGGNYGGGGGAGGYLASTATLSQTTAYSITVGGGGAGATSNPRTGGNGYNSSIIGTGFSQTAIRRRWWVCYCWNS